MTSLLVLKTSSKLSDLASRFDDFLRRYEILSSELTVSKNCNRLLSERIVQLERNAVNNAQYHRRESLEINPVPAAIGDDVLESSVCRALSLTGHEVKPDDLQACHRLKKKDTVIVKFKFRKQKHSILINRKNLRNKSDVLTQLNFSGRLFVLESMCHENHQLSVKIDLFLKLLIPSSIHLLHRSFAFPYLLFISLNRESFFFIISN